MTQDTKTITTNESYLCPFCGNELRSRFSKCFNIYCKGKEFQVDNLVIYRLNPKLGIGRIIKKLETPASESIDEDDTYFINKYKILFKKNIIKIIHPIDLIHYIFKVNEKIYIKNENSYGIVNSADFTSKNGKISYEVLYSNGKKTQINESEVLLKSKSLLGDKISTKIIDPAKTFLLKYWAHLFNSYYTSHQLKCITNSRLSFMPHQINVAHRLSEDYFPRMILADEVGLGKTIEAGIYIKEMMARNIAERILLIVPASLVKQWKFEMENKFHIKFIHYDGPKIKKLKKRGHYNHLNILQNPFYYNHLIICSLQFARNPKYIDLLSQISWDIVVFDEAHHLRRYLLNKSTGNYRETLNYQLARNLSQNTESLLLLTATPLQLHPFELYSLIELVHPEEFENFSDFEHFRKNIPFINLLIRNINQLNELNTFEIKNTIKLLRDLNYIKNNKSLIETIADLKKLSKKNQILKVVEKDHTLSKFLIRNRKKNVISDEYINERIVKTIVVNPKEEELSIYNEIRLYLAKIYNLAGNANNKNLGLGFVITTLQKLLTSSKYAFLRSLKKRLLTLNKLKLEDPDYYESEIETSTIDNGEVEIGQINKNILNFENQEKILREFYNKLKAIPYDSKSEKLLELLYEVYQNNPLTKVLIFTQFVDTLFFLKASLEEHYPNFSIDLFYGGLTKEQKAESVKRFRKSKKFSILLSTEIGGEGRNFQFCSTLINYDLPWNPMKIEQRIGRLDRIGQKSNKIYIYNFFMEGTIETDIVFALNKRINLFKQSIGDLEPILGKIEDNIKNLVFSININKQQQVSKFNRDLENKVKKAEEMQLKLDDLMIDKKSFQMDTLIKYRSHDQKLLTNDVLYAFILRFFDLHNTYGKVSKIKDSEENIENLEESLLIKIELSEEFLNQIKNTLEKQYIGTFNLDVAKVREDIDFFALGHPFINEIIKLYLKDDFPGNFSLLNINRSSIPKKYQNEIKGLNNCFLFVFKLTFHGFIIEEKVISILIDEKGNKVDKLAEFLLDIDNYKNIYQNLVKNGSLNSIKSSLIKYLIENAKNLINSKKTNWKREILKLNERRFNRV
jgi:SNF2 family DNA or RNA helicase